MSFTLTPCRTVPYFCPLPNRTIPYFFHPHPLLDGTLFVPSPIGQYLMSFTHTPLSHGTLFLPPPPIKQYLMSFTHTHPCRTVPYSLPSPVSIEHVYPSTTFHVICIVISTALLIQYLYMNKLLFMFLIYKMMNYNCNIM